MDWRVGVILILAVVLILTNLFQCNQSKQDRTTINLLNEQIQAKDSSIQIRQDRIDSLLAQPPKIKYKYAIKKDSIQYLSADHVDSLLRAVTRN